MIKDITMQELKNAIKQPKKRNLHTLTSNIRYFNTLPIMFSTIFNLSWKVGQDT